MARFAASSKPDAEVVELTVRVFVGLREGGDSVTVCEAVSEKFTEVFDGEGNEVMLSALVSVAVPWLLCDVVGENESDNGELGLSVGESVALGSPEEDGEDESVGDIDGEKRETVGDSERLLDPVTDLIRVLVLSEGVNDNEPERLGLDESLGESLIVRGSEGLADCSGEKECVSVGEGDSDAVGLSLGVHVSDTDGV